MKSQQLKTIILSLAALFPFYANAQTCGTLFFDKYNPRQHWENPANTPEGKFYIGMPVLSNISVAGGNNLFTFNDLFRNITRDGEVRTVPIISRDLDEMDNFLKKIKFNERVFASYRINLLEAGFKIKEEHYFTIGLSNRMESMVVVPNQFFKLFFNGMPDNEPFDFKLNKLSATANVFSEVALGYSRPLNDKISIGGKFKILVGHASLQTNLKGLKMVGSDEEWSLRGDGSIYGNIPGIQIITKADQTIDKIAFDDSNIKEIVKSQGGGVAVDLGVTYQMTPHLKIAGSILDLGFVKWKGCNVNLKKSKDLVFRGIEYEIGNDSTNFLKELGDDFATAYEVDNTSHPYTSQLSMKFNLGAEYTFWEDRIGVGVLSKTSIYRRTIWEDFMITANFRPFRWVSASLAYNIGNGQWNNLNAALDFNLGPVNLYFAMDNIPFRLGKINDAVFPIKTKEIRMTTGMSFIFGYKDKD